MMRLRRRKPDRKAAGQVGGDEKARLGEGAIMGDARQSESLVLRDAALRTAPRDVALVSVKKGPHRHDPSFDRFAIETVRAQPRSGWPGYPKRVSKDEAEVAPLPANCKSVIAGQNAPARSLSHDCRHRTMTDIRSGDWADRYAPAALVPYIRLARLDRPIGTWLLLFPGWWAIALAKQGWPDWRLFALFGIGAVAMRGAGCTLNDIVDRDFDARVARTRQRPLPSGAVSVRQAAAFLALQLAIGAAVLATLDRLAILLGFFVLLLIATYPLMKRVTYWPQFFLASTSIGRAHGLGGDNRMDRATGAAALCRRHRLDARL